MSAIQKYIKSTNTWITFGSGGGSSIQVDSELSLTSTNTVQNQAITSKYNDILQAVIDGKKLVADAITAKEVNTEANAEFSTMASNIRRIPFRGNAIFSDDAKMQSTTMTPNVTSIGSRAFGAIYGNNYQAGPGKLEIPNGVTSISAGAFWNCRGLTSVYIPDSVTSIGDDNASYGAFELCINLPEATIPGSVAHISNNTFSGCSNMYKLVLKEGTVSIGQKAFYSCFSLNNIEEICIYLPASLTYIGANAFQLCKYLQHIYYAGTEAQWGTITKDPAWEGATMGSEVSGGTQIHFNSPYLD